MRCDDAMVLPVFSVTIQGCQRERLQAMSYRSTSTAFSAFPRLRSVISEGCHLSIYTSQHVGSPSSPVAPTSSMSSEEGESHLDSDRQPRIPHTTIVDLSACCSRPPVRTQYTPRGRYTTLAGLKCYAVSPPVGVQAKAAILYIYDIHGFFPQTLCGADRLANAGFAVFMPDLLLGNGADFAMFDGSSE